MTLRSKALAATVFAASAVLVPVAPASAHGTCNVYAGTPYEYETTYDGDWIIVGLGQVYCGAAHDPSSYSLTVCLYHSPVAPTIELSTSDDVPLPPTARPVACTTGAPSSGDSHGGVTDVYTGCPYLPGWYRTFVSDGRAGGPSEHTGLWTKSARSAWVFIDGTACL
ncbi:MAG TPA: hypothetical protein VNA20_15870 [Frankiaceae bacterium]|nr:hypothetical protein [Frankiaceae bacterium]